MHRQPWDRLLLITFLVTCLSMASVQGKDTGEVSNRLSQWAKSPKKQSVGVYFKTHSFKLFFGDFAQWDFPIWSFFLGKFIPLLRLLRLRKVI